LPFITKATSYYYSSSNYYYYYYYYYYYCSFLDFLYFSSSFLPYLIPVTIGAIVPRSIFLILSVWTKAGLYSSRMGCTTSLRMVV